MNPILAYLLVVVPRAGLQALEKGLDRRRGKSAVKRRWTELVKSAGDSSLRSYRRPSYSPGEQKQWTPQPLQPVFHHPPTPIETRQQRRTDMWLAWLTVALLGSILLILTAYAVRYAMDGA